MSDSPEPFWPGSREIEVVVGRAVTERVDPLRVQLTALTRALSILADRLSPPQQGDEAVARDAQTEELRQFLASSVDEAVTRARATTGADMARLAERIGSLEASFRAGVEEGDAQTDALREVLAVALSHAVAKLDQSRSLDTERLVERIAQLEAARAADGQAVERSLAQIEAARAADATRLLEQVAALDGPLTPDAIASQAQLDDLRHTVATSIDQAVSRIETARAADAAQLLDQVADLMARAEGDARRRDEQASALLSAVDERLHALHLAGAQGDEDREGRLASRLEAITADHGQALLRRLDERTAPIAELSVIAPMVAAEVQSATAAALGAQVEPLVSRLVEAIDSLAHEGGRIDALARSHVGEARAVEERVRAMFVEVAERAESAVDRSRARIAEGQVALGGRFEATVGQLMSELKVAAERIEARLAESTEGLRAAGGHQNGALLDAVTRNGQQLGEGLAEVRAALFATGTEVAAQVAEANRRAEALADRLEALRSTIESMRHDPRLEALVVEQAAAREAQMAAIEAVSTQIDEVGPTVARALLSDVERAVQAASAAEEAVTSLGPDGLRATLSRASDHAAEEVKAATRRFDEAIVALGEQIGQRLARLAEDQARSREELAEILRGLEGVDEARLDRLDRSLAEALGELGGVLATTRNELVSLAGHALDRTAAVADEVVRTSGVAIDDLRASQAALREAVQDGAHKAELAALDIRGLRDRLTPHLVALAEATTRRAEADQAGFDAVLARLDQLLAHHVR